MKEKIILIGGGGHCHSCIDVIETENRFEIAGIVDSYKEQGSKVLDYEVIGGDKDLPSLITKYKNALICVGQIKSAEIRIKIFEQLKNLGAQLPVIVSPRAYVSSYAKIGEGTIVMHDVLVNANARIGVNCILNTKSLYEHDVIVGDHCHVSTAAVINGGSVVGNRCFVGSNTVLKQGISVADDSVVPFGGKL